MNINTMTWKAIISEHYDELTDTILTTYHTVTESPRLQVSVYIDSDGDVSTFEDLDGSSTYLLPQDPDRGIYCVTVVRSLGYDLCDEWTNLNDAHGVLDEVLEDLEREAANSVWYAAQKDSSDEWGNGSADFNEAMRMAKDYLDDGYPDAQVAVICDDVCACEYRADEYEGRCW